MRLNIRLGLLLIFLIAMGACFSSKDSQIVAHINDEAITGDELRRAYRMGGRGDHAPLESGEALQAQKRRILQEIIDHRLLIQTAEKRGVKIDSHALKAYLKRLRHGYGSEAELEAQLAERGLQLREWETVQQENFLIQTWLLQKLADQLRITEAELRAEFSAKKGDYREPPRVRARHIVVPTREAAEQALQTLAAGADFADLARKVSEGPEAVQDGDLGYFARGETVPVFAETCFALKVGETSKIVASDYGFHIFKVIDKTPARKQSFNEVKEQIHQRLIRQRVQTALQEELAILRQESPVEIHEDVLERISL